MKKPGKLINLYLLTLFLLGTIAIALRTIACFTEWNNLSKHFDGGIIIGIANATVVAAILLFATYPLFGDKNNKKIASSDTPYSYIPSGMLAVALLCIAFENLANMGSPELEQNAILRAFSFVIFILGIMSAAFFFLTVLIDKNENLWKAIFGIAMVAFLAVSAAYLYFDKSLLPTNSPVKITNMMAYLFAAVFFLFETRIALGRAIWRFYVPFGLVTSLLTAYSAIPALIYYVVNYADGGNCISGEPYECALLLSLSIFACARIVVSRKLNNDGACDAAICIEALAAKREAELNHNEEPLAHAQEDNNEEIEATDFENYTIDFATDDFDSSADGEND